MLSTDSSDVVTSIESKKNDSKCNIEFLFKNRLKIDDVKIQVNFLFKKKINLPYLETFKN